MRSKKRGNFVYSNSLSYEDAILKMRHTNPDADLVRSAALTIRNELLKLEKTKIPSPTSIYTLKSSAPVIPDLTNLFYRTLIDGLKIQNTDISESKVTAMASDAMFNVSRGSVKPWKHTLERLCFLSMTGSKKLSVLNNRLGHGLGYDGIMRIETAMTHSAMSNDQELPDGLIAMGNLASGE